MFRSISGLWFPGLGTRSSPSCSCPPQAVEAAQLAEDLKVQLEHVQTRLREIQPCLAESRAAREKESFNLKRAQEDISRLRRKLEKQRKVEVYADADEILQEEIKEYKVGYDWLVTVGPGTLAVSLK